MKELQADKIAFIVMRRREEDFQRLLASLKSLQMPEGYQVQVVVTEEQPSYAAAYQKGMQQSDAKYKIYFEDKLTVLVPDFLSRLLDVFQQHAEYGLLGVTGTKEIPVNGICVTSGQRVGKIQFGDVGLKVWCEVPHNVEEVLAVDGYFMATQYDIPWREDLFHTGCFFDTAQCLEFAQQGYKIGVVAQSGVWLARYDQKLSYDKESQAAFLDAYADEILPKKAVEDMLQRNRNHIQQLIGQQKYEEALGSIRNAAYVQYEYNQGYEDACLEMALLDIGRAFSEEPMWPDEAVHHKNVVFYDGFGLDMRGLHRIYLKALGELGYHIVYLVPGAARNQLPVTKALLAAYTVDIVYLDGKSRIEDYQTICKAIYQARPAQAFLYTTPYDVSGIMAFEHFQGRVCRYQVNLTDHAFWLGKYAFDYCLEFRDYGASVSARYRQIPATRLLKQPYYPIFEANRSFEGFPFEKKPGDFVVFSGGSLYKTMDRARTYYRIVDFCLREFAQTKFWYAGYGDDSELKKLMAKYPGRVFHTAERGDLFQVLQQVDLYLSTYPLSGGLMSQYSALAGCPPLTLAVDADENEVGLSSGELLPAAENEFLFSREDDLRQAIRQFILDVDYRRLKQEKTKDSVIAPADFRANLKRILQEHHSQYAITLYEIKVDSFHKINAQRYVRQVLKRQNKL